MKNILWLCSLVVMITGCTGVRTRQSGTQVPAPPPVVSWGEEDAGLRCRLSASSSQLTVPGAVTLILELENMSEYDIKLPYEPAVAQRGIIRTSPGSALRISKTGAGSASTVFDRYVRSEKSSFGLAHVRIPVGAKWSTKLPLTIAAPKGPSDTHTGRYEFVFELGAAVSSAYWKGFVRSNALVLTVMSAPEPEPEPEPDEGSNGATE